MNLCLCGCGQNVTRRYVRGHNNKRLVAAPVRFWAKVDTNGPLHPVLGTRCWLWRGATNHRVNANVQHRYGQFGYEGRLVLAHRMAWFLEYGEWPKAQACHRCDVPGCVNVAHLFDGTQSENLVDMVEKRRHWRHRGEQRAEAHTR